ncbi:nucleotide exchange factor GrpE [Aliidiomarina maris]|uniref:Protein GrpE n=1 Tax=Aliidiomarina maris TaxID=531312 RepID=A0A327WXI0_9GAMM|nr:nucleotide exchange factor GrpE [Aliidiomarina maris]MBA3988332.1 nucleotide exchange factor GrpE [Idiomarina sp.]MCL5049413.1 nucleotide exchange factor GrpE [Bacillota bacterium]RAJ96859.1 molecular chaperone GrpE [Aliidiomarina maris]RUO24201.1 nucleotide exchange factor GrpE [Aliidiomarina maris]
MTKPEQPNTEAQTEQDLEQPVETQADQEAAAGQEPSSQGDALARIGELEAALAAAQDEVQSRKDAALRAAAEAENVRRRAAQDVQKARDFALEKFAAELLSVVDNLERALQSVGDSSDSQEALVAGIEMTHKSFLSTLEKFGIASVDPQGQPFNPEQHEAMGMQESAEHPANTVLAVLQKGYVLNGRLLRPAMVMVSREPSAGVDTTA